MSTIPGSGARIRLERCGNTPAPRLVTIAARALEAELAHRTGPRERLLPLKLDFSLLGLDAGLPERLLCHSSPDPLHTREPRLRLRHCRFCFGKVREQVFIGQAHEQRVGFNTIAIFDAHFGDGSGNLRAEIRLSTLHHATGTPSQ